MHALCWPNIAYVRAPSKGDMEQTMPAHDGNWGPMAWMLLLVGHVV
jgi:hypothetical protein